MTSFVLFATELNPDMADAPTILSACNIRKTFRMGESTLEILKGADVTVGAGEFVAIEGRSGSGKSTLLHILGALDECTEGRVEYQARDIAALSSRGKSKVRNTQFGFVFQFYHLLPELNVLENTLLPAMVEHSYLNFLRQRTDLRRKAAALLTELGMHERLKHRPWQLSGGERQRVAIARALMNDPKILFADEPTGNLDAETGKQIMNVLEDLHKKGQTIVMVTHDRSIARQADRVLVLADGRLHNVS